MSCDERPSLVDGLPSDLIAELAADLRVIAQAMLRSERVEHTLQPTALVNELWLRIAATESSSRLHFDSRTAFLAYASRGIRSILVDHARRRGTIKRGGSPGGANGRPTKGPPANRLARADPCASGGPELELELDDELRRLEILEPRCARVFEMRFFGGMTPAQIGEHLGISLRTAGTDWAFARAWLANRLAGEATPDSNGAAPPRAAIREERPDA